MVRNIRGLMCNLVQERHERKKYISRTSKRETGRGK